MRRSEEYIPTVETIVSAGKKHLELTAPGGHAQRTIFWAYLRGQLDPAIVSDPGSKYVELTKEARFVNGGGAMESGVTLSDMKTLKACLTALNREDLYAKPLAELEEFSEKMRDGRLSSLDKVIGEKGAVRAEFVPDKTSPLVDTQAVQKVIDGNILQQLSSILSPQELQVLVMKAVGGYTFLDIGKKLGIPNRNRPSQIFKEAMGKIKEDSEFKTLLKSF